MEKGSACEGVLKAIRSMIRAVDIQSKMLDQIYGLTGPQLLILKELEHNHSLTTSQLANNITISQSTATIIIDRLVEKQLVERIRDTQDKRRWFIAVTPQGQKLLKSAPSLLHTDFIERFEKLPAWEQSQTLAVMQRVVTMFNTQLVDDSAPILASGDSLR